MDSNPLQVIPRKEMFKIILLSITISNFIFVLISVLYNSNTKRIRNIINKIERTNDYNSPISPIEAIEWEKSILRIKHINNFKTHILNIFNLAI